MAIYVALLRGIMPNNPNMRNEKSRGVFESLGLANVQTVISSGNVIFESNSKKIPLLERTIEKELGKQLGITSPTYVRSKHELETLVRKQPFRGMMHSPKSYLIVSFKRDAPREICTVVDTTTSQAAKWMRDIEKELGKDVTTRTWKTVERILAKMH